MGYNLETTSQKCWNTAAAVSILEWRISNKNPVCPVAGRRLPGPLKAGTRSRVDAQLRFDTG